MTPERDLADALERVSDYVSERATESPKVKRLQPTKAPRMVDLGARWRKELPLPMMATKRCVGQAVRQARAAALVAALSRRASSSMSQPRAVPLRDSRHRSGRRRP